jgi:hypothetical protein
VESGSGGSLADEEGMATVANSVGLAETGTAAAVAIAGAGLGLGTGAAISASAGLTNPAAPLPLTVLTGRPSPVEELAGAGPVSVPSGSGVNATSPPASDQSDTPSASPPVALSSTGSSDISDAEAVSTQIGALGDAAAPTQEPTDPRPSDLLTEFLPFDRASVEAAIDQFLGQFESFSASLPDLGDAGAILPGLATVAIATATAGLIVRQRRKAAEHGRPGEDAEALLERFSSLSGLWKLGLT